MFLKRFPKTFKHLFLVLVQNVYLFKIPVANVALDSGNFRDQPE